MSDYLYNGSYVIGVRFPVHVEHYGYISTQAQWETFLARVVDMLEPECNCVTPDQSCPACRARAAQIYTVDGGLEF